MIKWYINAKKTYIILSIQLCFLFEKWLFAPKLKLNLYNIASNCVIYQDLSPKCILIFFFAAICQILVCYRWSGFLPKSSVGCEIDAIYRRREIWIHRKQNQTARWCHHGICRWAFASRSVDGSERVSFPYGTSEITSKWWFIVRWHLLLIFIPRWSTGSVECLEH